jgi:hypothetical protein
MKIQTIKAALVSTAVAALAFTATTAEAATATGTARAKILRPVTVTAVDDLQFGTIITGAAASTVDITPAGGFTCGAGLVCSGTNSEGSFNITGTTGQTVSISVPASVTLNSGANSMTASLTSSASSAVLVANAASFTVGGSLAVGANQADGDYTGTYTVTVDYQ